jgi:hypothetical protein
MRRTFSLLGCVLTAGAVLGTVSCGGIVEIEDATGGAGGTGTGTDPGTGTSSSTDPGTGTGTSSSTGPGTDTGTAPDEAAALVAQKCPDIAAEPHYCLTFGYPDEVWAVGPDTGHLCEIGTIAKEVVSDLSSVAVVGTNAHGCGYDIGAWRASILGGPAEIQPMECTAITGYQGGFLLYSIFDFQNNVKRYASFEDIGTGKVAESYTIDSNFSRMTTRGDILFTAWHSTGTIDVFELPSATPQPSLTLEGFDDWVDGMSATADGRLYILSSQNRILAFDVGTGEQLQEVFTDEVPGGLLAALHCWSN